MVINTNIAAQSAAGSLGASSRLLAKSLARLSSGSKIVSPEDDAAGLAVSLRFDAQVSRTAASIANLGNATSFSQTQDGFLHKIGDALNRMSELAVSAQDITKTDSDRALYNKEFQTLATYVNNAATKDFNGVSLFSGNAVNVTTDSEGGTFLMAGINANYLTAPVTTTTTSTVGYAASTTLGQISSVFNGHPGGDVLQTGDSSPQFSATVTPGSTINDFVNFWNGTSGESSASYNAATGLLSVTANPGFAVVDNGGLFSDLGLNAPSGLPGVVEFLDNRLGGTTPLTMSTTLTHSVTTTTTTSAGVADISTLNGAAAALTTVKTALDQLATDRATVGATMSRLNFTADQLGTLKDNLTAANSRIKDVDVAQESTSFARYNILVQAGTSMLAQANNQPQSLLRLLA